MGEQQPLDPAIRNLISEGSIFKRDTVVPMQRQPIEDVDNEPRENTETLPQTLREKLKGGLSKLALRDTVEQPES